MSTARFCPEVLNISGIKMDIEVFLIYTKYQEIIKAEYSMNEMLSQILVTLISGMGASVALTDVLKMLFKKRKIMNPIFPKKLRGYQKH